MTGSILHLKRVGWLLGLAGLVLLGSGDARAWARRPWSAPQTQTAGRATPPATTQTAPPQGSQTAPPAQGAGAQGRGRSGGPPGQFGSGGQPSDYKWWKDETIKKEIALRDRQVLDIDRIYERRTKTNETYSAEYAKRRDEVDKMIRERVVDESALGLQIMQMQVVQNELYKSRVLMLYQMYKVLDPDQYQKYVAIIERQRAEWRRGRGGAPHPRPM